MRFVSFRQQGRLGLAAAASAQGGFYGRLDSDPDYPGALADLLAKGPEALLWAGRNLLKSEPISLADVAILPPLPAPGKIICIGLNYADHSAESGFKVPGYPTVFGRFASSLVGHGAPIVRPRVSEQLDYEGEFVAVIGTGGRDIPKAAALIHVAGYSLFNDASIRDFQIKSPQWTVGKNFDDTGAFGPCFVTPDELPPGCSGLRLQTRLNGEIVQDDSTDNMVFDVASLIAILSEAMTLSPGDIIVTGTPAGVGAARRPPLWMKPGDVCEVEMEGLGILQNPIIDQPAFVAPYTTRASAAEALESK
jgi:2-keto-4-pentenoate hydratase/2-oxohepta-3-ene-1,7-dioic acid hydratase in catechol pathway